MIEEITLNSIYRKLLEIELFLLKSQPLKSQPHVVVSEPDIDLAEYTFIDKSSWPNGDWKDEPDRVVWTDWNTGLICLINRHHRDGFLCGYVGVTDNHPLHGQDHNKLNFNSIVDFSGVPLTNSDEQRGLWRVNFFHWFGFGFNHAYDLIPTEQQLEFGLNVTYKDVDYVKSECRKLAAQLGTIK